MSTSANQRSSGLPRLATLAIAAILSCAALAGMAGTAMAAPYVDEVRADSPQGHWRLGEFTGTTAADQTGFFPGSYRNGTALGRAGALIGDPNLAAGFDGVNDHVRVASSTALNTRNAFTIEGWVKLGALPTGTNLATILHHAGQKSLRVDSTGAILLRTTRAGVTRTAKTAASALRVGTWAHVAAVFTGTNILVYVNGVVAATNTQAIQLDSVNQFLYFGSAGGSGPLNGTLDEIAVYPTALSAARLQAHYQAGTVAVDVTAPAVTLTAPANGSTLGGTQPTFSGAAGNDTGDAATVTVRVYNGTQASGTPVDTITTARNGSGWQATASAALAPGTYTAQAEQSDTAGNVGRSQANTFTVPVPAALTYRDVVMADSPRGYWRLGEGAGTSAADETGVHPGFYEGAPALGASGALAGDPSSTLRLDGVNDQVRVANAATLSSTAALSVETWLSPRDLPPATTSLVRKDGQYLLRLGADGRLTFRVWQGGVATELSAPAGTARAGEWQHVVATYNGSALTIYVDGTARASQALAGALDVSASGLYLGSSGGYDWLTGGLDEVAVYGTSLSAERIRAHRDRGIQGDGDAPPVTLTEPVDGSHTEDTTPQFSGAAGNGGGDADRVTVKIYNGTTVGGSPLQTVTTTRSGGSWSAGVGTPLAAGTYTAQALQPDAAGNTGTSATRTFTVDAPAPATYRDVVMADAPRAFWRFGESSGTTAADATGVHPGTYGPVPAFGAVGAVGADPDTAAEFDGIDDQVRVPHATTLTSADGLSLETWLKPSRLPSYSATLVRKDAHYMLRLSYQGALTLRLWKGGSYTEVTTATGIVRPGLWHHIVATHDGATMRIFLNGTERASKALTGPLSTSSSAVYLGSSGGYDWVAGTLDETAFYAAPLSLARIQAHYDRANLFDTNAPFIRLDSPAQGSTMDSQPNFGGSAGTSTGDQAGVTVKVYEGSTATGTPVQTAATTRRDSGTFSVLGSGSLPSGTYTAQAEQSDGAGNVGRSAARTFTVNASMTPALVTAGDIAYCGSTGDEATADLLDRQPGLVIPLGDTAYESGTAAEFANCYDPSWGRHLARSRPIVGDHEYTTPGAIPYYNFFGAAAGDPSKGYYSYDHGPWHVVALNSFCYEIGTCENQMEAWLEQDLQTAPRACTVVLLHEPLFSSGTIHGNNPGMRPLWDVMYAANVDVVLSGSEHIYERFAPQTPAGVADPARGIREFIVGTGGRSHYAVGTAQPNSEVRNADTYGVLRMSLRSDGYDWQFIPESGKTFTDSGSGSCH